MIQVIRYKCCGKIYAASTEPECYTDKGWQRDLRAAVKDGDTVEMVENGSWQFEKCTCNQENQFQVQYGTNETVWVHAMDGSTVGRFSKRFGMDIHTSITEQLEGKDQCLHCTHGVPTREIFEEFKQHAKEHWNVEIDFNSF